MHATLGRCAVSYGLERMNAEVSAWMRGTLMPDGTKALPPYQVRL